MSKKPLYLCDGKRNCFNMPCYEECHMTHDINHAVIIRIALKIKTALIYPLHREHGYYRADDNQDRQHNGYHLFFLHNLTSLYYLLPTENNK